MKTSTQLKALIRNLSKKAGVKALAKEEQRALVLAMRKNKVPFRQISRMTGISKGIIERWERAC